MTSHPPPGASRAHYARPTETTFATALEVLAKTMPHHREGLTALLDEGRFDDADAIVRVLEGSSK